MKATDLMVGDLVYRPACYDRVTEVRSNGIIGSDRLRGFIPLADLQPIPLTEEILKANGFYFGVLPDEEDVILSGIGVPISCDKRWSFDNENGGVATVQFPKDCDGGEVYVSNINNYVSYVWDDNIYVYQFQHILRFCGLNDLADNFKIQ